jgi:hypothetical protein
MSTDKEGPIRVIRAHVYLMFSNFNQKQLGTAGLSEFTNKFLWDLENVVENYTHTRQLNRSIIQAVEVGVRKGKELTSLQQTSSSL